jgi:hypothetical protein
MRIKEYILPEWAFLDAHSHMGDPLGDRTVILHVRSATLIEIFDKEERVNLNPGVIRHEFRYNGIAGVEDQIAVMHYSATIDEEADKDSIIENILKPCADFYCQYSAWEDGNIIAEDKSKLN